MKIIYEFLDALRFLTTLPLSSSGRWKSGDFSRSARWFPLTGALIGLLTAAFYGIIRQLLPANLSGILSAAIWCLLTGGLHLDGVSDCADGFFYSGSREARIKILKDVHHGTYGVLALTFTILVKAAAISCLSVTQAFYVIPLAAALGRLGNLWLLRLPLISGNGLAAALKSSFSKNTFLFAAIVPLVMALAGLLTGMILFAASVLIWILIGKFAVSRIGGINGDVLGLNVEWTETALLLVFCVMKSFTGMA